MLNLVSGTHSGSLYQPRTGLKLKSGLQVVQLIAAPEGEHVLSHCNWSNMTSFFIQTGPVVGRLGLVVSFRLNPIRPVLLSNWFETVNTDLIDAYANFYILGLCRVCLAVDTLRLQIFFHVATSSLNAGRTRSVPAGPDDPTVVCK